MAVRRRSGSSWIDASFVRRRSGGSNIDVGFVRRRSGSSWVDTWSVAPPPPPAVTITLTNHSISRVAFGADSTLAGFRLQNNGQALRQQGAGGFTAIAGEWMDPLLGAPAENYSVMATHISGAVFSGSAYNTLHTLGTTRDWTVSAQSGFTNTLTGVTRFRIFAGVTLVADANITLYSEFSTLA